MRVHVKLFAFTAAMSGPTLLAAQGNVFQSAISVSAIDAGIANAPPAYAEVVPLVVAAGDINSAPYTNGSTTNRGNGYDGVVSLILNRTDGTFLCSGSLLAGGKYVMTAAHCLANNAGANVTNSVNVNFFPGPNGNLGTTTLTSTGWYIKQGYGSTGTAVDRNDLAILALPTLAPTTATQYSIYAGSALGQMFDFAGFGRTASFGQGANTANSSSSTRFKASNRFDLDYGAFTGNPANNGILIADFDNPNETGMANDPDCIFFNVCGGAVAGEGNTAPGDSGGGAFITVGGVKFLAGVTSFGMRRSKGVGLCPDNTTFGCPPDIDGLLNSSFGEMAGWVTPDINLLHFNHYGTLDPIFPTEVSATPEPGTLALAMTGLLAFAGVARRRQRRA